LSRDILELLRGWVPPFNESNSQEIETSRTAEEGFLALQGIASKLSSHTGEAFLRSLVVHLAETLGVACVLLGDFRESEPGVLRTLAFNTKGQFSPPAEFALAGTAAGAIISGHRCLHIRGAHHSFPGDAFLTASRFESYAGVALKNSRGETTGILAAMDPRPLDSMEFAERLLRAFTPRATIELERARNEETNREAQVQLQALLDANPDVILIKDAEGRWLRGNRALQEKFDLIGKPFAGKSCSEVRVLSPQHAERFDCCQRTDEAAWTQRVPFRDINSFLQPDGRAFVMETIKIPLFHADGSRRALVVIGRDITDFTRAIDALLTSESRYQDLFENANDIVYTHDLRGRITSINRTAERLLGYSREELLDMNIATLVHPEDHALGRQMLEKKLADGGSTAYVMRILTRDGRLLNLEVSTRLSGSEGRPTGVQCIARDVSERKRLEDQLRQAQKMEAVGRLAGGIAHDFNNLLMVIGGRAELLLTHNPPGDTASSHAEEISKAADRAASLTKQLLAFSRRQVIAPRVLDLNSIIEDTEKMLKRLIGEDIDVVMAMEPELGRVLADPGQIDQILMNLAVNARDAMPQGGKIIIETSNLELDEAFTSLHVGSRTGSYVLLAFSDTGCGMDAETMSHIFEPFFTTKEAGKGTGMGLSTVYGIVKQSGGYITVYSEPGHGTTFKIYLPRIEASAVQLASRADAEALPRGSETILLVEDDRSVRELTRALLRMSGYTVLEAKSAEEAMQVSRSFPGQIQLLLTDVVMPSSSGSELAASLHAMRPQMRVLFMSGYTDDAILHHGVLRPGVAFLQKPVRHGELARKVREVLSQFPAETFEPAYAAR